MALDCLLHQAEKLFNRLLEMAHEERTAESEGGAVVSTGVHHSDAIVGTALECESEGEWYTGRVVAVEQPDTRAAKVLFHFNGWSKKYDEWLPMLSDCSVIAQ